MEFQFVKETPKVGTKFRLDFSSLLGPLFFTWVVQMLFPVSTNTIHKLHKLVILQFLTNTSSPHVLQVILTYLVYEKQQKLKIMMKIHGLTDGPYWLISYLYFLLLSAAYIIFFVIFGSLIGSILLFILFLFFYFYMSLVMHTIVKILRHLM